MNKYLKCYQNTLSNFKIQKIIIFVCIFTIYLINSNLLHAVQITVMDIKPIAGVKKELTSSLTPVLVREVDRRQNVSVISMFEITELLKNESNKQYIGCNNQKCLTDLSSALGSQLLLVSNLSKIKNEWHFNLSLISIESTDVIKRSSFEVKGNESAAKEAVIKGVKNLFIDKLPVESDGPPFLSRRGFKATLLGLKKSLLNDKIKYRPFRKKVILDLINTELDYDVEPKLQMLLTVIKVELRKLEKKMIGAKSEKEYQLYEFAYSRWIDIDNDQMRVREIRKRARESGLKPSANSIHFEEEEIEWPDQKEVENYKKIAKVARKIVKKALKSLKNKDFDKFNTYREHTCDNVIDIYGKIQNKKCELLPFYATNSKKYKAAISKLKDEEVSTYIRCSKDNEYSSLKFRKLYLKNWRQTG